MNILFVFIMIIISVSCVRSDPFPCVICAYAGKNVFPDILDNYKFDVADVPERCDIVLYGEHYFNAQPNESDATSIKALTSTGKTVYMLYSSPDVADWGTIISDSNRLDNYIAPMLTFLNENNIKGVILGYLGILLGVIPDYATKINTLISKIKQCVPSIKVGLYLSGSNSNRFKDKQIFDFTVINTNVDFYEIDLWTTASSCQANSVAMGGRLPVKSNDGTVVTLEKVCKDTSDSPLNQSKLLVNIFDSVSVLDASCNFSTKSYSEFCKGDSHGNDIWCGDTTQILYDEVTYLKKVFKGIMISYLEFDDNDNTCGCGKFPVANTFIDAWNDKPITNCAKIS